MANPFFNNGNGNGGMIGNFQNMVSQFNQFRQNVQGDPRSQVENLLKSGKMSQAQFNDLYSKAVDIYNSGIFQNAGNPFNGLFSK